MRSTYPTSRWTTLIVKLRGVERWLCSKPRMPISDRTRRILWARSGNRCAVCRTELVLTPEAAADADAVVGDECHIVARAPGGARYRDDLKYDADGYDNLILLCKTHHKLVDDQFERFHEEYLLGLKAQHEQWVRSALRESGGPDVKLTAGDVTLLPRVLAGRQLVALLQGAEMYQFDHEQPESNEEGEVVAGFMQDCQDYADILSDLDARAVVQASVYMQERLEDLQKAGFLVFGERKLRWFHIGSPDPQRHQMSLLTIVVLRESNPAIIRPETPV